MLIEPDDLTWDLVNALWKALCSESPVSLGIARPCSQTLLLTVGVCDCDKNLNLTSAQVLREAKQTSPEPSDAEWQTTTLPFMTGSCNLSSFLRGPLPLIRRGQPLHCEMVRETCCSVRLLSGALTTKLLVDIPGFPALLCYL
jgi:hypothetical protein